MNIIVFFDYVTEEDPENQYKVGEIIKKGKRVFVKCSDKLLKLKSWQ